MRCRAVFLILILLLISGVAFAFSVNADVLSLATLFTPGKGGRLNTTFDLASDLRLDLSLGVHIINTEEVDLNVFECDLVFDYFPFDPYGFYTGVSLLHLCYLTGLDCPASPFVNLLDIRVGYLFVINHFSIDIRLNMCELGARFSTSSEILQDNFYQFKKYNLNLFLGWKL